MLKNPQTASATSDARRFYFGALTPAMADHLRHRAAANAQRDQRAPAEAPIADNGNTPWPPIKDWQD
ncbi:MAG: hypothetical protein AB7O56_13200 [Bauldia sp.]